MNFLSLRIRVLGLSLGKAFAIYSLRLFDLVPACDGQTDGQANNPTVANTGLCIWSYCWDWAYEYAIRCQL